MTEKFVVACHVSTIPKSPPKIIKKYLYWLRSEPVFLWNKTVPLPIEILQSCFCLYNLLLKVKTPARITLVLLCFHPDTVRYLTPLYFKISTTT